ncbi:MAG: 50S ribosomal protein L21 [Candidatus Dormibacteria bacterium]|jgi:large subunit ribosomal protein L21
MKPPQSSDAPRTEAGTSATFAVVRHGGHQYRVTPGDRLVVDRLASAVGDVVGLEPVLLLSDGDGVRVDPASLEGIRVAATVAGHIRGRKIRVFTFKPKKRHRRTLGFRAEQTELVVDRVLARGEALPEPVAVVELEAPAVEDEQIAVAETAPQSSEPARPRRRGTRAAAAETAEVESAPSTTAPPEAPDAAAPSRPARRPRKAAEPVTGETEAPTEASTSPAPRRRAPRTTPPPEAGE